ncbi:uncharacterized protein with HEPN domain [Hydrogenispora ethanolica]|jgi:uncharacterized protein with HEPN domain|uniref:Uncharacterized protein with HEPN domain n=1 Tax=Hydrogenispora ethanolica TaxID=1082276 RepID=A0A4R1S033_HYDET|nr:HepT-like ribonuclease domain-containing protein [Hydrogenispora ethanolica]TCL72453.1 uncharacterized protein with HEPN domain [Hydrogenispora ethanolica]
MNSKDGQVLQKIISEIEVIEMLVEGFDESSFSVDERTKRAVCMTLLNIGELVKHLTGEFKLANGNIPWRNIAGLRDITAHQYQALNMGDVWHTVRNDIPLLKRNIMKLTD